MKRLPRQIKRHMNQLAGQAYENELGRELEKLAVHVDEWRAGRIEARELARLIHEYDTGPLLDLHKSYNAPYRELLIASALQRGLFQESDIPKAVWPYLENAITFAQANLGEDDVDDD